MRGVTRALLATGARQVHEFILSQFATLWEEYASARGLIPRGNLVEVSYDELARDPVRKRRSNARP